MYTPLGILDPSPLEGFSSPGRIRNYIYAVYERTALDSVGICYFCGDGYYPAQIAEIVKGVTGWETSIWELMKVGERAMNRMQVFDIQEGFTREDDRIPERFHQPLAAGPLKGFKLDKEEFEKAKDTYCGMMDWDKRGNPMQGKLQELGLMPLALSLSRLVYRAVCPPSGFSKPVSRGSNQELNHIIHMLLAAFSISSMT